MLRTDINIPDGMMLKQEVALAMYDLIDTMPNNIRIVEIGSGYGQSAKFFSELKPEATIYTIDAFGLYGDGRIYPHYDGPTIKKIIEGYGKNVIQILGNSHAIPWELPIDVLFIDGDHTYTGCKADFERYSPFVKSGGIVVFDDYTQENNFNNGVKDVVAEITNKYELIHKGYYSAIFKKK